MSRTGLDATTIANSLRMKAGDGSIEWVSEPIQASVLLDIADMLDENAKLRELCEEFARVIKNDDETFRRLREIAKKELNFDFIGSYDESLGESDQLPRFVKRMRELGVEVSE